jgi:circadian clock protein KaiB
MTAETAPTAAPRYAMTLFVTGASRLSLQAVSRVRAFCEEDLSGNYDLEVVDLYRAPERAKEAQVIASPTLLRDKPVPVRRVIGDMSDSVRLRAAIKVVEHATEA